jgi:phospholipid N-methyltransferase
MSDFKYSGEELNVFEGALNWKSYWVKKIRPHIGKRILEVGAGIGATTVALRNVPYESWVCIEPDTLLCKVITQKRDAGLIASNVEVKNCTSADLVGEKFDTILYIDVLEHIEKDCKEIQAAASLLNDDGKIIVLSPAHNYLYSAFDNKIGHYRRYNKKKLINLTPDGLGIIQIQYMDSIGFFASLANRLILKQSDPSPAQIKFWDRVMVPFSRIFDPLFFNMAGKSIIVIYQKKA